MAHETHNLPDNWEPGTDSDLNVPMIVFVSLIGSILLVVIVFFLRALYFTSVANETMVKLEQTRYADLSDLTATQLGQIHGYAWVNAQTGTISMPIDRAMELVVSERSGQGDPALSTGHQMAIPGDFVHTLSGPGAEAPAIWSEQLGAVAPHPSGVLPTGEQVDPAAVDTHGMPPATEDATNDGADAQPVPGQPGSDPEGRPGDDPDALPDGESEGI